MSSPNATATSGLTEAGGERHWTAAMPMKRWVRRVLIGIATMVGAIASLIAGGVWYVRSHSVPRITLDTPEGRSVLRRSRSFDYEPLARYWVQQGQMLCCAASAVIAMNSVKPEAGYSQDGLFVPETAGIKEDLVLRLDPRGQYHWAWLPLASLYEAMNTTDDVSAAHRGWLLVRR